MTQFRILSECFDSFVVEMAERVGIVTMDEALVNEGSYYTTFSFDGADRHMAIMHCDQVYPEILAMLELTDDTD